VPIDKLALVRIEEGRLLCARSRGKSAFFLPGGKREAGESDAAALCREIEEELGVRIRPETMRLLRVFEAAAHGQPEGVLVRLTCYAADFDGEPRPAAEIEELAWLGTGDRARMSLVTTLVIEWLVERGLVR